MADPAVRCRGLVRTFRAPRRRPGLAGALHDLVSPRVDLVTAVDGLDLDVHAGEIVGLLGPNGAGKSTTVKCLTGLLQPTAGEVLVGGLDPWRDRERHVRRIGVVFGQRSQLWWDLAVQEAYDLLATVFEVPEAAYRARLSELTALLDLEPLLARPVRTLSLGQRVRADLAASLIHEPAVLFLDEPTLGLDAAVRRRIRRFVRQAADGGLAVVLTTHDVVDVASLCDRVVLLDRGSASFAGDLDGLAHHLGAPDASPAALESGLADRYEGTS